jgi:hypothetical protein
MKYKRGMKLILRRDTDKSEWSIELTHKSYTDIYYIVKITKGKHGIQLSTDSLFQYNGTSPTWGTSKAFLREHFKEATKKNIKINDQLGVENEI